MVALGANNWPDVRSRQYFDPRSHDPLRRLLCCLFVDNDEWRMAQRSLLRMPAWNAVWTRMRCVLWRWHASVSSVLCSSVRAA